MIAFVIRKYIAG